MLNKRKTVELLKKSGVFIADRFFSTSAAGLYMLLFAVAIGVATFIENDFGTSAAQKVVFKTRWFEILLVLFGIALIVNVSRYRMIQQRKWMILLFHLAIIVILAGAGVTRYFGYEGMMGIREGETSSSFLSSESYIGVEALLNGKKYKIYEPVLFASLGNNHFDEEYRIGSNDIRVKLLEFIPNPTESIVEDEAGGPVLKVVFGGSGGREEIPLRFGERTNLYGTVFNFGNQEDPEAFNIMYENNNLTFKAPVPFMQMVMATQQRDTIMPGNWNPLMLRSMYSDGQHSFVFGDFKPKAKAEMTSGARKMTQQSKGALRLELSSGGKSTEVVVVGSQGVTGTPKVVRYGNLNLAISYGARKRELPFAIKLRDFIMEKYPGTSNASSYASEVTLLDSKEGVNRDQRIFMNNILDYGGYRFFQSSYDPDELGTYLSVNHDFWGTWISYIGYILLTIGMVFTFFDPKSRFRQLSDSVKRMRQLGVLVPFILALCIPQQSYAGPDTPPGVVVNRDHADQFGSIWVQDLKGRCKPMNTYTGEILRKLSRKSSLFGLTSDQIILGMALDPEAWYGVPIIKLGSHEEIKKILKTENKLVAYNDFFDETGQYKLKEQVRRAYNVPPRERDVFDKELMKLDEKVNICSMVFSGRFMKSFPVPGDETNDWYAPETSHVHEMSQQSPFYEKFYPAYVITTQKAAQDGDWSTANVLLKELTAYQHANGKAVMPSDNQLNAELFLNKLDIFNRLGSFYGLLGLVFLGLLFTAVFKPGVNLTKAQNISLWVLFAGFALHTLGLGLRWYVSERAPWSNGYESMIYIGWTTTLAGLIFSRKSLGGLAATSVLVATILMVAGLSWLDPEITPLVPVLKSYWLTIHVSLEAGSYGFLVLGAIIGALNLIFMIFANQRNKTNVYRMIRELTYISEMTVTGGLVMLSVGTYLGGIWANESWGRYWGWDAKETWALVTILVYAFILHMRMIPGLRGLYAFNVASLFGWASVMMTYFGVNYYLSGLHSYAAGDPVPVPSWVYYSVAVLTAISLLAWWKDRSINSPGITQIKVSGAQAG